MRFWFPFSSSSARRKNSACHADRAKSSVLGTRISRRQEALAKKKDGREKAQKLRHGRSRLHGYFGFVNGERSFSLHKTFSPLLFLLRFFSLTRVDPRRRAKPHKGNIADRASTASSPPQVPPRLSGFLTPASFFFTHPPPCSSRHPSSLSTYKFTQPLRPDRG